MHLELLHLLERVRSRNPRVVVLTGAGISAESGIRPFRGSDGYWVVGSRNYMPEEMAIVACLRAIRRKSGGGTCIVLGHAGTRSPILAHARLSTRSNAR